MICVVCGFDNIEGTDRCENCGAELRPVDIPTAETPFEARMQRPVTTLRPHPAPFATAAAPVSDALAAMRDAAVDCVLVTDGDRLVGIFTERDAVLKLAGRPLDGVTVGDAMTADPTALHAQDPIAAAVQANPGMSARDLLTEINRLTEAFACSRVVPDDRTAIVIRRL